MTLNTEVYVLDEIDPMEVFRFCQGLLANYDEQHRSAEAQQFTQEPGRIDNNVHRHRPACWLSLDFDTAYGYKVNGMGCGDLHAALVGALGEWLTSKGIRWLWANEFTGEVHDDPRRLVDLMTGGFEAQAWFATTALPAILAHAANEAKS